MIEDGGSSTSSSGSSSGYGSQSAIKLDEPSTSNEGMSTIIHLKKCGTLLICSYYSDPILNSTLQKLTKLGHCITIHCTLFFVLIVCCCWHYFYVFFNHVTSLIFYVCLRFCLFFLLVHLSIVGLSRIDNLCGTSTLSPTTNLNNNHFYAKPLLYQYTTDRTRRYNLNTPTFTLQSPLQHRPIVENITTDTYTNISNSINYGIRRAPTLRRSDSYSPGMVLPSIAKRRYFWKLVESM